MLVNEIGDIMSIVVFQRDTPLCIAARGMLGGRRDKA